VDILLASRSGSMLAVLVPVMVAALLFLVYTGPMRGQRSGVKAKHDLWEIHRYPYDVSRVWVRNHWDGRWITLFWKHLPSSPVPFGELAWDHAREQLAADGKTSTEREIAAVARALLQRAHQGPDTKPGRRGRKPSARNRGVAARTKATSEPSCPRPEAPGPGTESEDSAEAAEAAPPESEKLADVVPCRSSAGRTAGPARPRPAWNPGWRELNSWNEARVA
jgi:hypothetical protein